MPISVGSRGLAYGAPGSPSPARASPLRRSYSAEAALGREPTPGKDLIRVHLMAACYFRHRDPRRARLSDDARLLLDRAKLPRCNPPTHRIDRRWNSGWSEPLAVDTEGGPD